MTLATLAIWFALFLFPPVIKGRWAQHNMLRITRPEGPINRDGSTTAFAHVQEKGEFRLCKLFAIAAGVPFVFAAPEPIVLLLQPIAMIAVDQIVRAIGAVDYAGHGAEILAAERAGDMTYRAAEIARLQTDQDKRGDNVAAMLLRWEWLARIVHLLGRW
jgi:hypothetical protein